MASAMSKPLSNWAASSNTIRSTGSAPAANSARALAAITAPLPTSRQTSSYQCFSGLPFRPAHASHGRARKRPRPISVSMPCRRWRRGCRYSTPKVAHTRPASAPRCPTGSIRNGKFIPMSSTSGCLATRQKPLSWPFAVRRTKRASALAPPIHSTSKYDRNAMRRTSRCASFASVVLAVNVSACAMFETGQTKLQAVKTVGIISAVGDQMPFAKGGLTGIDNRSQNFPIGSWGLDDLIVQQATAALTGRFQVQPVTYKRAAFAVIEKDSPVAPVNFIRGDPFKKLVETEVSPQGLDAYVVITKAKANFGGGGRKLEGIGFLNYGTVMASYSQIHALYEIRVFDGKTFDVITKMTDPPVDNVGAVRIAGPSRMLDESFAPGAGDPAQNEKLHAAITDLVARSLPPTLSDMHLADVR